MQESGCIIEKRVNLMWNSIIIPLLFDASVFYYGYLVNRYTLKDMHKSKIVQYA